MYGLINLSFGKSQRNAVVKITIGKNLETLEVFCIIFAHHDNLHLVLDAQSPGYLLQASNQRNQNLCPWF